MERSFFRIMPVLFFLVIGGAGCASLEGARLYSDGTAALDRGETEEAIDLLEQAAQKVPQGSEIQNHLGLAYAAAGRHEESLIAFRRAVEIDCQNRAAQHNLKVAEKRLEEQHREQR